MKGHQCDCLLENACAQNMLDCLIEEYIVFCRVQAIDSEKKSKSKAKFPNVAGFCRYFGISEREYRRLSDKYSEDFGRLRAVLEDEALNADISPTVISAYLKKRFGYDRATEAEEDGRVLNIVFEHDVSEDGE